MAFGQAAGPPATAREIARLAELLDRAGYGTFKESRHQVGLTQRQAGGKFTRQEAAELTARLEAEVDEAGPPAEGPAGSPRDAQRRRDRQALAAAGLPDDLMAAELELRGWTCIPSL